MNKTIALVTGASSGLGFETSLMLAEKRISSICHDA